MIRWPALISIRYIDFISQHSAANTETHTQTTNIVKIKREIRNYAPNTIWIASCLHCRKSHSPRWYYRNPTTTFESYCSDTQALAHRQLRNISTPLTAHEVLPVLKLHPNLKVTVPQKGVHNRHHCQKQLLICQERPTGGQPFIWPPAPRELTALPISRSWWGWGLPSQEPNRRSRSIGPPASAIWALPPHSRFFRHSQLRFFYLIK